MRQGAKWPPEEKARCFADSHAGGVKILLRCQSRQLLNVVDIDDGIRGNQGVSGCNHLVEPVDADKQLRDAASKRSWASYVAGNNLRVCQVRRNAKSAGKERRI